MLRFVYTINYLSKKHLTTHDKVVLYLTFKSVSIILHDYKII